MCHSHTQTKQHTHTQHTAIRPTHFCHLFDDNDNWLFTTIYGANYKNNIIALFVCLFCQRLYVYDATNNLFYTITDSSHDQSGGMEFGKRQRKRHIS